MDDSPASAKPCWVCAACGKTSSLREGGAPDTSPGWDVSCAMHAVWCRPRTAHDTSDAPWIAIEPQPEPH